MSRLFHLLRILPRPVGRLLRHGRPRRALLFGPLSLGDDLLCTAVLREARRRRQPFAMLTNRPELFRHNPDPTRLVPIDDYYVAALRRLGTRVVQPYYLQANPAEPAREPAPPRHIIAEMCRLAGLHGEVTLRPYLHLTADERARGSLFPRQVAIHSTALTAAIAYPTKEWGAERLDAVARALGRDCQLVQLGAAQDPPLPVARDLRGRTTLREAAAVLAASAAFVGLEGFLTHLARAVDCPAVVVFGGRAEPRIFGYDCNVNLYSAVECAPCGLRDGCPYTLKCLAAITPESVVAAVRALVTRRPARPLAAERILLP